MSKKEKKLNANPRRKAIRKFNPRPLAPEAKIICVDYLPFSCLSFLSWLDFVFSFLIPHSSFFIQIDLSVRSSLNWSSLSSNNWHSFQFHTIPLYSILFYSILFYSLLFYSILFYCILFLFVRVHRLLLQLPSFHRRQLLDLQLVRIRVPGIGWMYVALYCHVLDCLVLSCIVLYCVILYCVRLHSIPW
jgi:hypothetical protein